MTALNYPTLFEKYNTLSWANDPFGLFVQLRLEKQFGDQMREELDALHKSRFPRRRKIVHDNLPEELVVPVREKWVEKALAYYQCALGRHAWVSKKLEELAQTVELVPTDTVQEVYSSNTNTYRSQGWGAQKYARQDAEREADHLRRWGFAADVESRRPIEDCDYTEYRVMANAEPWQLNACRRRGSLLEWATDCWRNGTNPKVYNPFLDDATYEKSCDIAMGR